MKKPLIDPYAVIFNRYLEESKFIKKFLKYWGTMSITAADGTVHEVLLPSNFVWSERSRPDVEGYPYELGGNVYKNGNVYPPNTDMEAINKGKRKDAEDYNTTECEGVDLLGDNPTAFYKDGAAVQYVKNEDGTVKTDESGEPVTEPADTRCTVVDGMRGYPKYGTRIRKLLDMLESWKDIKDHKDIPQTNTTWLYLNPSKGLGINDDNVISGINKFLVSKADKQGRIELKVTIPLTDRLAIPQYQHIYRTIGPDEYIAYEDIPLGNNLFEVSYVQEPVYQLDAEGNIVTKKVYERNSDGTYKKDNDGKVIPTGVVYPSLLIENVPRYENVESLLAEYADKIWTYMAVVPTLLNTPEVEQEAVNNISDVFGYFLTRMANSNRGMYEKVVAKTAAVYASKYKTKTNLEVFGASVVDRYPEVWPNVNVASGIRVKYARKGSYQWVETVDRPAEVDGSYRPFNESLGGGATVSYSGHNYTDAGPYQVTYTVPTLEVTLVVRNLKPLRIERNDKNEIVNGGNTTPIAWMILDQAKQDYWKYSSESVGSGEDSYTDSGIKLFLTSANGYDLYAILRSMYGDSDDPSVGWDGITYAPGKELYWGSSGIPVSSFVNPRLWVVRDDGDWWYGRMQWYYLKKEVLTTNKYIKKRSDRIKLVMSLVDVGYDVDDVSMSFLQGIFFVVIIAVAAYIAGPEGGATTAAALAKAIIIFSLIISVAAMMLASSNPALARQLASFNKSISPIVMVASIYLTIMGMYDMYNGITSITSSVGQELTEQVFTDSIRQSGYTGSTWASDMLSDRVLDVATAMVDDVIGMVNNQLSSFNLEKGTQVVDMVVKVHYESELAKLKRSNESKQQWLDERASVKEERRLSDYTMASLLSNLDPLTRCITLDAHEVAYEPVVSAMHSGNVQKTAHLALMGDSAVTYINNIA